MNHVKSRESCASSRGYRMLSLNYMWVLGVSCGLLLPQHPQLCFIMFYIIWIYLNPYNTYLSGWHPQSSNIMITIPYNASDHLQSLDHATSPRVWNETAEIHEVVATLRRHLGCARRPRAGHWMSLWCHGLSSRRKTWCWFPLGACRHCSTKPPREPPASIAVPSGQLSNSLTHLEHLGLKKYLELVN